MFSGLFGLLPAWGWLLLVAVGLVLAVVGWERYRPRPAEPGRTLPTTEVFVDPESGRRLRVWVDPATGRRSYHDDGGTATVLPPLERPGLWLPPPPHPPALPPAGEPGPPAEPGEDPPVPGEKPSEPG